MPIELQPAQTLAEAIASACTEIDAAAEQARLAHITGGAGQALTYREKSAQATACIAAGAGAVADDYPLVAARAEVAGLTLSAAAQQIADRAAAWQRLGAQIEREREMGKLMIRAAENHVVCGREFGRVLDALAALRNA